MYKNALNRVMETTHFKKVVNERIKESDKDRDEVIKETIKEVKISGAWSYPKFREIWIIALLNFIYSILYRVYFEFKWRLYYKKGTARTISLKD